MKRRVTRREALEWAKKGEEPEDGIFAGSPKVQIVRNEKAARLVTFEHPDEGLEGAKDAFVRLKPPEGLKDSEVDSWANAVRKVAKAVKVLPVPKSTEVPDDAQRVEEDEKVGTIREEAMKLAEQTEKPSIVKLTKDILDAVGA